MSEHTKLMFVGAKSESEEVSLYEDNESQQLGVVRPQTPPGGVQQTEQTGDVSESEVKAAESSEKILILVKTEEPTMRLGDHVKVRVWVWSTHICHAVVTPVIRSDAIHVSFHIVSISYIYCTQSLVRI